LKELSDAIASKTEAIVELEGQIGSLESSLNAALADVGTNKGLAEQLAQEKLALEDQLRDAKEVISSIQSEEQMSGSVLASLRDDVSIFCIYLQNSHSSIFRSLVPQRLLHKARTNLFRTLTHKSRF
jgi:hypothetical protein